MFDAADIALPSGARLTCRYDQTGICVALDEQRVTLPYPDYGLGGGEMVVAPDGRHAALFLYTGQSEQGYELFALEPSLRHIGGLPCIPGEGAATVWSPDGRFVAMLVGVSVCVHEMGYYVEYVLDPSADGVLDVDIAELVVQDVVAGTPPSQVRIHTTIPASLDPGVPGEWTFYEPLRFVGARRLAFLLPSGAVVETDVPPAGPIAVPPWLDGARGR